MPYHTLPSSTIPLCEFTSLINNEISLDDLSSFEDKIKLQAALKELHNCTNTILDVLKTSRDNGAVRELYHCLATEFHNAYEIVDDEEGCGVFAPLEIIRSIGKTPFDELLDECRFQDQHKIGVYCLKDAFNPRNCFTSLAVSDFGCLVSCLAIERRSVRQPNTTGIIEFNAASVERRIQLGQYLRPINQQSTSRKEHILDRFINIHSEGNPVPFFASQKDVSIPPNRRFFGLSDISVVSSLHGNKLDSTLVRVPGIHGSRLEISSGFGTAHGFHNAFAGLYSVSALLSGFSRIWIIIPPDQRLKIRKFMSECLLDFDKDSVCSGCPLHKAVFFVPLFLDRHRIKYVYFEQEVGEVVITIPGSFIQSYNTGSNVIETSLYADKYWEPTSYALCDRSLCLTMKIQPSALSQIQVGQVFESTVWPDTTSLESLVTASACKNYCIDVTTGVSAPSIIASPLSTSCSDKLATGSFHHMRMGKAADQSISSPSSLLVDNTQDLKTSQWEQSDLISPLTMSLISKFRASNAKRGPLIHYDFFDESTCLFQNIEHQIYTAERVEDAMSVPENNLNSPLNESVNPSSVISSTLLPCNSQSRVLVGLPSHEEHANCSPHCNSSFPENEDPTTNSVMSRLSSESNHKIGTIGMVSGLGLRSGKSLLVKAISVDGLPSVPPEAIGKGLHACRTVTLPVLDRWYKSLNSANSMFPSPSPQAVFQEAASLKLITFSAEITNIVISVGSKSSIEMWITHMNETFLNLAKPARFASCLSPREEFYLPLESIDVTTQETLRTLASIDSIFSKNRVHYSNYLLLCRRLALQVDHMAGQTKYPPQRRQRNIILENLVKTYLESKESRSNKRKWVWEFNQLQDWYARGAKLRKIVYPIVLLMLLGEGEIPVPKHHISESSSHRIEVINSLLERNRGKWIRCLHLAYRRWFERIQAHPQSWKPIDLSLFHTYSECDVRILELFH